MANTAKTTKVVTGKVRLSYAHIFQPFAGEDGKEKKYSVTLLIPKGDKATLSKMKDAIEAAKQLGTSKWGGKIPPNLKMPVRDGDAERPDQEEYKGMYFVNCSSKTKPGVVDKDLNAILDPEEVYSGCYARASVNFYPFAVSGNKGVACGLNNIQKLADGDFLGGRTRAEDDFEAWGDDGGDDFLA